MSAVDTIVINANIRTMEAAHPGAEALAVKDGRIVALGDSHSIRDLANGGTRSVDAGGRLVLPGFQDTHIHLQDSGIGFATGVDLTGAHTLGALQDKLREQAAKTADDYWVQGLCFSASHFNASNLTREMLDEAVPDRPLFIMANDGHNAAMNSLGLRELNITGETPDPANGTIVRQDGGEPNGFLHEDAIWWALGMTPKPSEDDYRAGVRWAAAHANRHGLTGVLDAMVDERHLRVYTDLDNAGELNLRVASTCKVFPHESDVAAAVERLCDLRRRFRSDKVYLHSAKFFIDGVMENGTAAMLDDYVTGGNAPIMFEVDHLMELLVAFDAARFQLHQHTIGDRAVRVALDGIAAARAANGPWPALHQLAHIQSIDPADIPRFRELGAIANWQPLWAQPETPGHEVAAPLMGPERMRYIYAVKSVIDTGAPYAISSDWFVTTLNPFEIMQVAVTRQTPEDGPDGPAFFPEERIDVETVVQGYTNNAAAGAWRGDVTGSLSLGKFADLIVVDRDIFNIDAFELGGTEVLLTMLEGADVHRADGFDG
jgi:predicted amidohydrolase YtcJ